ncbi:MAG TPA: FkbM family methyltransferase [Roseiarcus sp.]|nr:FkbM family methyltransferase [Roseiarcus sp.]
MYYDIGANTGIFSIDAAYAIRDLRVYCFEPQPTLARNIKRSIDANGFDQVRCVECLLGPEDGERALYLTSHSIHASIVPRESRFERINVRMRSLDSLVRSQEITPPDIMKMDVEGSEIEVLMGAREIVAANEPSIIFEADENLLRVNKKVEDVLGCVNAIAPYQILKINEDGGLSSVEGRPSYGNYLALAPKHVARLLDRRDVR